MNDPGAVRDLVSPYGWPRVVVLEACCGAADFASELIRQTEWNVLLAHPGYVKRMKEGPNKTDRGDAWCLEAILYHARVVFGLSGSDASK